MKNIPLYFLTISLGWAGFSPDASAQSDAPADFKKTILTRDFISEGVAVADLNKDGRLDIIAG